MSATDLVRLDLGPRSYDIHVGAGLLQEAGDLIEPLLRRQPALIVTDDIVAKLYLAPLQAALDRAGLSHESVILAAGEATKNFAGLERLVDAVLDTRPERGSALIALGGGVIGDITGFAASVILRGIDFIQVPTTLLAQVDSSVGGKTGINTRHGKNLVGSFHQPRLVIVDTALTGSLPKRELLAGYAEIVKYGLLGDAEFFRWLEHEGGRVCSGDPEALRHAVVTSCRAKAAIVAEDETETGRRALLNLGHTFGHALEIATGFGPDLLHGEAVAIGMVMAFDLSAMLGLCSGDDAERARHHLALVGLPTGLGALEPRAWRVDDLLGYMRQDKKVRDGTVNFILARAIGDAFAADDVALEDVARLLEGAIAA